ncbi:MAG: hypothetical protein ACE5KU_05035 [Nitrososphaerales archaeon]
MDTERPVAEDLAERLQDEFPGSALGLIGCHSSGEAYPPCEYDYLIVSEGKKRFERRLIGERFVDILFVDEDSVLRDAEDLLVLALIDMVAISDPRWILTPVVSKVKAESSRHLRSFARRVMFKSLQDLGRFRDALDAGNTLDAGFWLKSSAYSLATALTAYHGTVPRISHLLSEFRRKADASGDMFELWSEVLGLNLATDVSVTRRLDAFRDVVYAGSGMSASSFFADPKYTYMLTEARSNYLVKSHAVVDAYCYLGGELTRAIEELYELRCRSIGKAPVYQDMFSHLMRGDKSKRWLSMQTVRLIGINPDEHLLREQGSRFKDLIRTVAKSLSKE